MNQLGVFYEEGRGVPQNFALAREWYANVSSKRSSIGRPSTPPASLIILAATSAPSLTWVPWDTEPGGE
jgi:hypothetical protein